MSTWELVSEWLVVAGIAMLLLGAVFAVDALAMRLVARHVARALNDLHYYVDEP